MRQTKLQTQVQFVSKIIVLSLTLTTPPLNYVLKHAQINGKSFLETLVEVKDNECFYGF